MKTRVGFALLLAVALGICTALSVPQLIRDLGNPGLAAVFGQGGVLMAATLTAALALQVVGHLIRSEKQTVLLRGVRPIGRAQVFRGQMIGFMFNALLPLRVGEVLRAHYVGRAVQISRSAVLATIMLERAIDLLVVAALGGVAVAVIGGPAAEEPFAHLVIGAGLLLVLLAGILVVCYRQPRWFLRAVYRTTALLNDRLSNRTRQIVWSFNHALQYAVPDWRTAVRYLTLTAVMWLAYIGSVVAVFVALADALGAASRWAGFIDAPYLGVTSWTGPALYGAFRDRAADVLGSFSDESVMPFVLVTWGLLVIPSVVIGALCLLHRRLVEHVDGVVTSPLIRNKLFRDLDTSEEFAHLLATHFQGETIGRIVSRQEAAGRFTVIRPLKGGSNASTLLVWQDDEIIVKKITLPEYRSKLRSQHDWLASRADVRNLVNVTGQEDAADHFSIDIEFREGYLSFFEHLHASSKGDAWSVLERVLDFVDSELYVQRQVADPTSVLDDYIATKIVDKVLDAAAASPVISRLSGYEEILVNGERLVNFPVVVDRIRASKDAMRDLAEFAESPIHGDLTVDNLMVDPSSSDFMVIDPNDENLISDPIVDYAKLLQSLHSGYEFLVMHDVVEVRQDRVSFEERRSSHYEYLYDQCQERFVARLSPARHRALLFHEAVHYCRMLTYRAKINPESVALFYCIAIRLFNRFLEQYEPATRARAAIHQPSGARELAARA